MTDMSIVALRFSTAARTSRDLVISVLPFVVKSLRSMPSVFDDFVCASGFGDALCNTKSSIKAKSEQIRRKRADAHFEGEGRGNPPIAVG
jgi:hypothetical protein